MSQVFQTLERELAFPSVRWAPGDEGPSSAGELRAWLCYVEAGLKRQQNDLCSDQFSQLRQRYVKELRPQVESASKAREREEMQTQFSAQEGSSGGGHRELTEEERKLMFARAVEDLVGGLVVMEEAENRVAKRVEDATSAADRLVVSLKSARSALNSLAAQTANDRRYFLGAFAFFCFTCLHIFFRRLKVYWSIGFLLYNIVGPGLEYSVLPVWQAMWASAEMLVDSVEMLLGGGVGPGSDSGGLGIRIPEL